MTWFKVDDSFHSHPKALATPLAAIGLWSLAGAWSSNHLTDGFVPDYAIPSLARGQTQLADELVAAGLWRRAKGGYLFHQWDADSDGTPRNPTRSEVTAARSKQSSGGAIGNHRRWHVKQGSTDPHCRYCQQKPGSDSRSGTRSDTDQSDRIGTESHPTSPDPARPDPSSSSGTDQKQDPLYEGGPGGKPPPRKRGSTNRGTRLPDAFTVTPEMVDWAREHTPHVDGRFETAQFRDYWRAKSGKDATKLDWVATWRNWMRKAEERAPRQPSNHRGAASKPSTTDQRVADIQALKHKPAGNDPPILRAITGGATP